MLKIIYSNPKTIEWYGEMTKVYVGDNNFNYIEFNFPDKIESFPRSECSVELRAYTTKEHYLSYSLSTEKNNVKHPIALDMTDASRTLKLLLVITHNETVIGFTNALNLNIHDSGGGSEISPREGLDRTIAEQVATITRQETEIATKDNTISQQSSQITELNGEVTELTTENTRLENQHETDLRYIDYLIDNPPEARLQPKSVEPTNQMQVVEPDEGYQGLSTVTVGATTPPRLQGKAVTPTNLMQNVQPDSGYDGLSNVAVAAVTAQELGFNKNYYKKDEEFLGETGTYNPFPYNSVGGIYITEVDEDGYPVKFLIKNYQRTTSTFPTFFDKGVNAVRALEEIVFENCPNITDFGQLFRDLTYLKKATLPENFTTIVSYAFLNCRNLTTINIPKSLTSIGTSQVFFNCPSLEYVIIENGFNCNGLNLSNSTLYSHDTILSWFNALADRTGQTAYTLTIGTTNLNKMTAEEKAIATNKNWNLA